MSIAWSDLIIEEDIAAGNFGVVRRADYLGTDVAIKEFLDIADQPDFNLQKYVGRELEILSASRHPNIAQFMGSCVHENKVYLITEYVSGGNLKKWIQNATKPASWRLRVSFATDIARALVYLHAHSIIHRDLKSENLLVTENCRLKLCDFGLSRETAKTAEELKRMSFCGTDGYMAPEIMLGMDFDERVDVFSFGVILCEIVTWSVADQEHFRREIPYFGIDPATVVPDAGCPPELLKIALSCTDADATKRPQLKEVLQQLRKLEVDLAKEEPVNLGILAPELPLINSMRHYGSSTSIDSADGDSSSSSISLARPRSHTASQTDLRIETPPSSAISSSSNKSPSQSLLTDECVETPASASPGQLTSGSSPIRRIGHFVPHRFSLFATPTLNKCQACGKRVGLGHKHLSCDDCSAVYHRRCAAQAPPTCGLPADLRSSLAILDPSSSHGKQRGLTGSISSNRDHLQKAVNSRERAAIS